MKKYKCDICNNKIATWMYVPTGKTYCNKCIDKQRGCDCNILDFRSEDITDLNREYLLFYKLNKDKTTFMLCEELEATHVEYLDDDKKRFPCCEFDYEENGFEIDYEEDIFD